MTNNDRDLLRAVAAAAIGAWISYYARAYLVRTRGVEAAHRFTLRSNLTFLSGPVVLIAGFFLLPDLPVSLQNTAAVVWMITVPALFLGPFIPMAVYARRESRYRRAARGPLAARIREDLHQYFPRSMP